MPLSLEELAASDGASEASARAAIARVLQVLEAHLPAEVDAARLSRVSKYPFKAAVLEAVLGRRVVELASETLELFDVGRDLASAFTCRGAMETAAVLVQLARRLEHAVRERKLGDTDDFLMRGLFGWNAPYSTWHPLSVGTAMDHAAKTIETYRGHYSALSDLVHPNYAGTHGAYASLDDQYLLAAIGERQRIAWDHVLVSLVLALVLAAHAVSRVREVMPAFIELSDRHVRRAAGQGT